MIIVVTGLAFEARIAAGPGVRVICQQNATLAEVLAPAIAQGCEGLVSFGTAGGLSPALRPGAWVIARSVIDGDQRFDTDPSWAASLRTALPESSDGDLVGVADPVVQASDKAALHHRTQAIAADMESHIVARLAAAHALPFVCCRVVIDSAERSLPEAALAGMRADGSTDVAGVIRSLLARPAQLPALLGVARDAGRARQSLIKGRSLIGPGFGYRQAV